MTERERLIGLIKQKQDGGSKYGDNILHETKCSNAELADFLLENGVIVPPYKIDTTIWTNEPFTDGIVRDGDIIAFEVMRNGISEIVVNFDPVPLTASFLIEDVGKTVFLTREEAEKALKEQKSDFIGSANDVSTAFIRG